MKRLIFIGYLLFIGIFQCSSQMLTPDYRFKVLENNDTLLNPYASGLNSPVFAEIDLDGNGTNDLLIFEKSTRRKLTFINNGTSGQTDFHFAPEYVAMIPVLEEWVRSYDYDCDGDLDLFTYTVSYTYTPLGEGATKVYRNDFSISTGLVLTPVANELLTTYNNITKVIPSSPVNLPAMVDIDFDGDMDILAFSLSSNFVEYHKNYSIDSTASCAGFLFHVEPFCWGQFKLSGVENKAILNSSCLNIPDNAALHSGSVLTAYDQSCDGDIDLINGDSDTGFYFCPPAAMAGYPHITVPMGTLHGLPVGFSLIASAYAHTSGSVVAAPTGEVATGFTGRRKSLPFAA